jgi:HD-GYP domain-containing protein (c-di-GMP phosphodiesterase class II)
LPILPSQHRRFILSRPAPPARDGTKIVQAIRRRRPMDCRLTAGAGTGLSGSTAQMSHRIKLIAGTGEIVRSVGISAMAIALAVYAMVLQERNLSLAALGAVILLVAVSAMLQVSRAVTKLHHQRRQTYRAAMRAEHHYFKVLRRIIAAIENREPYTRGRSRRVGHLARRMGEQIGLPQRQCRLLGLAGQIHDIGEMAVPDRILNKPSRLGAAEYRTVKKHPEVSYRILEPLTFLAEILPAVRYHHERMNGTGYPAELQRGQIPLLARILAVADTYDAMTHDRPHRPALPPIEALNEMRRCSPAGFDGECVAALEEVMNLRHLRRAHAAAKEPARTPSSPISQEATA